MPFHFVLVFGFRHTDIISPAAFHIQLVEEVRWFALLSEGRYLGQLHTYVLWCPILNIPAGYRKTPPYSKSRLVRTYVPASSTFALVLVADELLRENVVDDVRSQNQEHNGTRFCSRQDGRTLGQQRFTL